ncbi:zinc-dependent alcohol dehydrogenase family protein [Streptomyces sp. NPDC057197]|uniref:zinc-dependent alcohol dehydrogenase family protein n=1 Tax=Streptomyces sp. NPDC057197 TaxID=3346045 RepID=UPI00363794A1
MVASTVNPSDAVTVSGAYGSRTTFPLVPGFEGVGVIEAAGPGVPPGAVGLRVLPLGSAGAWQQYKRLAYPWCVPVPDDLPDEVACFAYVNPLTAVTMVERFCGPGVRHVVVTAATSAIGGQLAELLAGRGITPVGVVRGTPGRTVAEPSRWRAVIASDGPGWRERLRAETGPGGADVVLDCVGGDVGGAVHALTARAGVFVHYGLLSGTPLPASASPAGVPAWSCSGCATSSSGPAAATCPHCSRRSSNTCATAVWARPSHGASGSADSPHISGARRPRSRERPSSHCRRDDAGTAVRAAGAPSRLHRPRGRRTPTGGRSPAGR